MHCAFLERGRQIKERETLMNRTLTEEVEVERRGRRKENRHGVENGLIIRSEGLGFP